MCIGTTSPTASSAKLDGILHGRIVVDGRETFVPCERLSDGVIGYYGLRGKTFWEPTGSAPTPVYGNLFDSSKALEGYQVDCRYGYYGPIPSYVLSDYIPVTAGESYLLSYDFVLGTAHGVAFFNSTPAYDKQGDWVIDYEYISGISSTDIYNEGTGIITAPQGATQMLFSFYTNVSSNPNWQTTVSITKV